MKVNTMKNIFESVQFINGCQVILENDIDIMHSINFNQIFNKFENILPNSWDKFIFFMLLILMKVIL